MAEAKNEYDRWFILGGERYIDAGGDLNERGRRALWNAAVWSTIKVLEGIGVSRDTVEGFQDQGRVPDRRGRHPMKLRLTYFKTTGRYYSDGTLDTESDDWSESMEMARVAVSVKAPGLTSAWIGPTLVEPVGGGPPQLFNPGVPHSEYDRIRRVLKLGRLDG